MIKIRGEVFETNSSSVHSLTFGTYGMEKCKLKVHKDGYIHTDYGKFDKNFDIFNTQAEKLSYLATCAYYIESDDYDVKNVNDSYFWKRISEAIAEYVPNCKGVKIMGKKEPYIDHQSIPSYDNIEFLNTYDKDTVVRFVFNRDIWLKTDCD